MVLRSGASCILGELPLRVCVTVVIEEFARGSEEAARLRNRKRSEDLALRDAGAAASVDSGGEALWPTDGT